MPPRLQPDARGVVHDDEGEHEAQRAATEDSSESFSPTAVVSPTTSAVCEANMPPLPTMRPQSSLPVVYQCVNTFADCATLVRARKGGGGRERGDGGGVSAVRVRSRPVARAGAALLVRARGAERRGAHLNARRALISAGEEKSAGAPRPRGLIVRAEDRVAPGGARDPSAPAARDQRVCRAPDADVSREFGARICPTGDRGEWDAADGLENDGLNASTHLELGLDVYRHTRVSRDAFLSRAATVPSGTARRPRAHSSPSRVSSSTMAAAVAAPPAARAPRARHPARTAAPTRACAGCVAREAKALARRRGALATLSRGGSAGARAPPASRCAREDPPDADPPGGRRPRADEPSDPSEPYESSRDDSRPSRDRDDPTTPSEDPDP